MEEEIQKLPYYSLVPKNKALNLIYREVLLEMADKDEDVRQQIWIASSRDQLFFVNTMLWVFEPREAIDLPFVTWPFQDRVFTLFEKSIGKTDLGLEKSRDMGASWMFLTSFFYRWLFRPRQAFGLVSRTEDAVDKKDDPDCLMWKLDYHYRNLPRWMQPKCRRVQLSMANEDNHSVITGYSATADVARGGRKLAFGLDELAAWQIDSGFAAWASTQHVTNSRVAVSTPQGMAGVFADQMKKKDAAMIKVSVHWSEHPQKQRGLYRSTDGNLEVIDTTYDFPPDYPFVLDGKLRSPWYDEECRRHPVPALIAQELDIDYGGSGFPFFNSKMVDDHARQYVMDPFARGDLDFSTEDYEPHWRQAEGGNLLLWINLTADQEPAHVFDYVIGCDISTGTGGEWSTNSVASVFNQLTGEKVAEFATNDLYPDRFADVVIALRKWFRGPKGDAFVAWESNGPGAQFSKHFMENSPQRVYYRQNLKTRGGRATKMPGWRSDRDSKRMLLGDYAKLLERHSIVNRSAPALEEMLHYIYDPSGSIDHDRSKATLDPTSAGENHGDRVIADALAAMCVFPQRNKPKEEAAVDTRNPPAGSMAWRFQHTELQKQNQGAWL